MHIHRFQIKNFKSFIELIKLVDKSTWIDEWDFLNKI